MAINYFSQLGFDRGGEQLLRAAQGAQGIRANQQAMQINQQNMQRQQQADQQAMLQFQNAQQRARAAQGAGAFYNALNSGNTKAALKIAQQYQDDINSLGDPTFTVETVSQMMQTPEGIEQLKQMALGTTQLAAGPEQMARFSAEQAKSSQPQSMTDYQKTQTELRRQEIDLQRERAKLDAMMKAEQQQTNEIKKQELQLKIQQQQQKLDDAERQKQTNELEKNAALESGLQSTDNLLLTLDQILSTPSGVIKSATGPISTRLPTVSQDTADFEELINKFDSQAFIAQIPMLKGTGALSDAEGRKLSASLQNLSLRQSPQRLLQNVKEAKQIMDKARQNLLKKYGAEQPAEAQKPASNQDAIDWSQL